MSCLARAVGWLGSNTNVFGFLAHGKQSHSSSVDDTAHRCLALALEFGLPADGYAPAGWRTVSVDFAHGS